MKRDTQQRAAIEAVFKQHDRPLTVDEILVYGQKIVESLNQATIYRNIKILVEQGSLTRIYHPDVGVLFEQSKKEHHHHFHCRSCRRIFDIPGCHLSQNKLSPLGFIMEAHDVFFFGLCPNCTQN